MRFHDIDHYKAVARKVHRLWQEDLGEYKIITASVHLMLAHGHLYLQYSQDEYGCANGVWTEGTIEGGNKYNRDLKFNLSRKDSLEHEREDVMRRHLVMSDPHVQASYALQPRAPGRIGKGNGFRGG